MSKKANPRKIGAFVIGAVALVVTAVAGTPQNMSFTLFLEVTG